MFLIVSPILCLGRAKKLFNEHFSQWLKETYFKVFSATLNVCRNCKSPKTRVFLTQKRAYWLSSVDLCGNIAFDIRYRIVRTVPILLLAFTFDLAKECSAIFSSTVFSSSKNANVTLPFSGKTRKILFSIAGTDLWLSNHFSCITWVHFVAT